MPRITPNLWMDTQGLEAAEFYCSIFPNSKINFVSHYTEAGPGKAGTVLTVDFELDGQPFTALNGGPQYRFTEAVSFFVSCETQEEVDHYWSSLSEGGEEGPCGWLKDRFGLSWQTVPVQMSGWMSSKHPAARDRVFAALIEMEKLDLAALERAYEE